MSEYDLTKILPHKPPMILIDDILEVNLKEGSLVSLFRVYPEKQFFERGRGINSIVGIEFMAQTIGCFSYFKDKCSAPKPGLLLGTRLYNNQVEYFEEGIDYTVKVHEVFTDNEIVVFDCLIYDNNDNEIARATINAYQGTNIKELLKE